MKQSRARRAAIELNGKTSRRDDKRLVTMDADLYGNAFEPLMPLNLTFEKVFTAFWNRCDGKERFKQARLLAEASDFFGTVIYLKELFFNDGFNFGEKPNDKLEKWLKKQGYNFARVANDAWQEWLTCDNIIAFWQKGDDSKKLPVIAILDCEICRYTNAFGVETLAVKFPNMGYSPAQIAELKRKGLPDRYIEALKGGKELIIDESKGEYFKVLTRAKLGKGLAAPRVGQVLTQLSTMDLFGIGDWAWASQLKKAMRQISKGHDIRNGPLAGQSTHFIKKKEAQQIRDAQKNKDGAYDAVTNFDVKVGFPFPDPRVFDMAKMEGTLARLEHWAGPVGRLLLSVSEQSPYLMDAFEAEGKRQRQLVGDFLASIFNDENFYGEKKPVADLVPRWNPRSFVSVKNLIELSRFTATDGIASPQTVRKWYGLDDKEEGDNLEEAAKKRQRYTPPFEAKQGMVAGAIKGGRPVETPSGVPAPA